MADGLGNTMALVDGTGQTQYTYEAFGQTATTGSGSTNQRQYTGRENDGTELYFYRRANIDDLAGRGMKLADLTGRAFNPSTMDAGFFGAMHS